MMDIRAYALFAVLGMACLSGERAIAVPAAAVESRPHIILIVADDLGFADVGFRGSDIRTPHLDSLASQGVILDRFYAMPFCTPTRSSLLTGRYPFRYGLQTAAIPVDGEYGLNTNEFVLPDLLKTAGYRTAIVGKWHLGHAKQEWWPGSRGFDHQYGPLVGEIDYFTHSAGGELDWYRNHAPLKQEGYATELIGQEAEKVILNHNTDSPLFLYLTFTAPHAPYQAPTEYERQYAHIEDKTRQTYAGMISCLDDQIGKVFAALKKKSMRENTFILFMSDNGGNRTAAFSGEGDVSELVLPASNAPYRGGKGDLLEGGCRVVAVASWPRFIRPGRVAGPMHTVDVLPTLSRLAGIASPEERPWDGVDQWAAMTGKIDAIRTEVVYNIEPYRAAISQGQWKLLLKASIPPQVELYDLENDPGESMNVAAQHPDIVERLRKRINMLAAEAQSPLFLKYAIKHHQRMKEIFRSMLLEK